ncbi:tetratricopeptide repeat protein [Tepidimonas taiwanensis]|uniref:tetratricopeptide repeat protein n=1 Tax=Tepidimonas taiwanensis TaxID=307486 RepID=UPI00068FFF6A|nr:tetratricopeptide repeat protein [Tepidimonas taiwanensis]
MSRLRPLILLCGLLGTGLHAPHGVAQTPDDTEHAAASAAPSPLTAELFYQLLLAELQRRDDPGAAYSLVLDAAKRTRQPALFRRAIEIALQGRAGNAALTAARDWRAALPDDDDARRAELQLLLGLQRVRETGPVLRDWIRAAPPARRAERIGLVPAVYARVADKTEAVAAARAALEPYLNSTDTAAAAWAALGQVQRMAGQDTDALQSARQAIQANPAATRAALLALALFGADAAAAEPLVQRHLQAVRESGGTLDPDVAIAYAQALGERGRLADGLAVLRDTRGDAEAGRRLRSAEARLLRDHDRVAEAYDVLAQALREAPGDTDLMYELAMVAERLGRLDEMERLLRDVIARKPDDAHAYNALGYALADRGLRLDEAKALIQEALRRAPDDAYIIDSLGWVEYRLGNLGEARRLLADAMQRRPDAEIAAHLGEVLWVSGERDEALAVWRRGLALDGRNRTLTETLRRLGVQP